MESKNYPVLPINAAPNQGGPAPGAAAPQTPAVTPTAPAFSGPPAILTGLNYWHLLAAFRRRWRLAVGLGLVVGAIAAAVTYYLVGPRSYTAYKTLRVAPENPKIIFTTEEGRPTFDTYTRSQLVMVKSRLVLNAALRDEKVAHLPVVLEQSDGAIDWLGKQIQADYSLGSNEFMSVHMTGKDAESPRAIVEAVCEAYLREVVNAERTARLKHLTEIEEFCRKFEQDLDKRRSNLRDLHGDIQAKNAGEVARRQDAIAKELNFVQNRLVVLKQDLLSAKLDRDSVKKKLKAMEETPIPEALLDEAVRQDPEVQAARLDVAAGKHRLADIKDKLRDPTQSPAYQPAVEALEKAETILKEREKEARPRIADSARAEQRRKLQAELAEKEDRVAGWENMLTELTKLADEKAGQIRFIGDREFDLDAMNNDIKRLQGFVDKFRNEQEALRVEISAPARVNPVVDESYVVKNDYLGLRYGAGAGLAGFLVVVVGISLLEFQSRRVSTVNDVSGGLRLPVVGTLPLVNTRGPVSGPGRTANLTQHLLIESVDSARAVLMHAFRRKNVRTVMVSSAGPGEGKTMLAAHLAASIARAGWRVLLVDGDMRRPSLHKVFGVPGDVGLGDVLRGEANLREVVQPGPLPGLWVVPAGYSDAQTMCALAQGGLTHLLDEIKTEYDFVLIDSAPVLPVADSQLIAQAVDGVVLSVLQNVSRLPAVYAAYERLMVFQVDILGVVVHGTTSGGYGNYYPYLPFPAAKAPAEKKAE
jgi:capsular exopolysaccharide synthesis family protein